jgi:hypothetical protein
LAAAHDDHVADWQIGGRRIDNPPQDDILPHTAARKLTLRIKHAVLQEG